MNPRKGPWLEREVLDQDLAIEKVYSDGVWHVEKYLLVQMLRIFGMRTSQLSYMKISDVRLRKWGHSRDELRWPYLKNDESPEVAYWWPIGGAILTAMEVYLDERLAGIAIGDSNALPLFLPDGLPGVWRNERATPAPNEELGYEGHPMSSTINGRFRRLMRSLKLSSYRSGSPVPMHFSPHRERHTAGTRLALKGYSASMIAMRLGHKSRESCNAYVDLARMAMQLRNPKFFHLLDGVGAAFSASVASLEEIEKNLDPVISVEASSLERIALIGGADCRGCIFANESASGEPWPCLSCPRFQLYEDADLQTLWEILQERREYMHNDDGSWNARFDPDVRAQIDRYEALLIGAEAQRREVTNERKLALEGGI